MSRAAPPADRTDLRPTRLEIDLRAVRANVARLREVTGVEVCAVVKADGYGHGAVPVARAAVDAGAAWLAVALVEEGVQLREAGFDVPILLLTEPPVAAIPELLAAQLTPTVYRAPFIAALDGTGHQRGRPVDVHLKLDTGMGRVGVPPGAWRERLEQLALADRLHVTGLYTHLARADELGVATTAEQLTAFERGLEAAAKVGVRPRWRHAANTAGALAHAAARYDLVRPGIGVYGLSPGADVDAADHGLRPALSLHTEVAFAKRITAGTPVSYGHRWRAPEDGWLAVLPLGYGDGMPRALTNRAQVLVRGRRRPVVGTVCMDQVLVWCAELEPTVGEPVVLLGEQDEERIRVEEWAAAADTITYEIVTQLTARLPRRHLG
jgi:alanine racemase